MSSILFKFNIERTKINTNKENKKNPIKQTEVLRFPVRLKRTRTSTTKNPKSDVLRFHVLVTQKKKDVLRFHVPM
jgi:hypothetical protein